MVESTQKQKKNQLREGNSLPFSFIPSLLLPFLLLKTQNWVMDRIVWKLSVSHIGWVGEGEKRIVGNSSSHFSLFSFFQKKSVEVYLLHSNCDNKISIYFDSISPLVPEMNKIPFVCIQFEWDKSAKRFHPCLVDIMPFLCTLIPPPPHIYEVLKLHVKEECCGWWKLEELKW